MRVYSYLRFSTPEQARGDSLRRQTTSAEAWCADRGLALDDTLTMRDLGVSAFKGRHAQFGALKAFLDAVEGDRVERGSVLLVESLDRLSREAVLDAAARLFDLIRAGITVVTLSDGQEYSERRLRQDWTPLVISLAVMARAHDESRIKSERVGKAWAQKRIRAATERQAQTAICPGWIKLVGGPRTGHYELIPERAEIVRSIFSDTIGGLGRRAIAQTLNARRVPTWGVGKKKGVRWHDSYIQKVLGNPATYGVGEPLGRIAGGDGSAPTEPIEAYYPAAIDEETYYAAQAAARARGTGSGKPGTHRNLLRGIARCARCGSAMIIVDKGARSSGPKLICGAAHASAGCDHRSYYPYASLEATTIWGLGNKRQQLVLAAVDTTAALVDERAAAVAKREALQLRLSNLVELVAAGGGGAMVAGQTRDLQSAIDEAGVTIETIDRELGAAKATSSTASGSDLVDIYNQLNDLHGDDLVRARAGVAQRLKSLIMRIEVAPAGVEIKYADATGGFISFEGGDTTV